MSNGKGQEETAVVEYQARDGQKIKLSPAIIKKYLVSGRSEFVTDQELYLYMGVCKSRGLNPFVRDCHLVKYTQNDGAAIITSIDYYRKRARAQKDCKGWSVGIVIEKGGELIYRKGTILLEGENLVGGWAEATPEGWAEPMRKEVNLKRYIKTTKDGGVTRFWQPMNQPEMIAKVAESQLLRSLWPDEFQGLYVDSEVQSRDAQEELHGAVAGGSAGGVEVASFDSVFEAERKDSAFDAFVADIAKTYGLTAEAVKERMLSNAAEVKTGFVAWKAAQAKLAESEKEAEKAFDAAVDPGEKAAEVNPPEEVEAEAGTPKTFRDEWITMSAKSFGPFVNMELKKFKALDAEQKAEAAAMWEKFYPGFDCPFAGAVSSKVESGGSADPEASELEALRDELKDLEKKHGRLVLAAKKETQIVNPMSVDGFRILIDAVNTRLNKK